MSLSGKHWRIDGVDADYILRGAVNGAYRVVFDRTSAELPAIETINWQRPTIEHLVDWKEEQLPAGYGFDVTGILYDHNSRRYTVMLQVSKQYLGDVTDYQAKIEELNQKVETQALAIAESAALEAAIEKGLSL